VVAVSIEKEVSNAARDKALDLRDAYQQGWIACFGGADGRFCNPHERKSEFAAAWNAGFLDAMEAGDCDECEPEIASY
jgi:hypothetical protein